MTEEEKLVEETKKVLIALNDQNVEWIDQHYASHVTRWVAMISIGALNFCLECARGELTLATSKRTIG